MTDETPVAVEPSPAPIEAAPQAESVTPEPVPVPAPVESQPTEVAEAPAPETPTQPTLESQPAEPDAGHESVLDDIEADFRALLERVEHLEHEAREELKAGMAALVAKAKSVL